MIENEICDALRALKVSFRDQIRELRTDMDKHFVELISSMDKANRRADRLLRVIEKAALREQS